MSKNYKNRKPNATSMLNRRRFLRGSAGAMGGAWLAAWPWQTLLAQQELDVGPVDDWDAGKVRHLLPAVSDSHLLIKTSLSAPISQQPRLRINGGGSSQTIAGLQNDTAGEFWQFYAEDLRPDTVYELRLEEAGGAALCEPWPISTFPAANL
ncbi:MAG: twin-arginine translocation signal domain-containing protein, partial [Pseudomonadales bacterium]|nr:twin-arginine translocation signal domain-containing protein [Pseudomonadales bacterium]